MNFIGSSSDPDSFQPTQTSTQENWSRLLGGPPLWTPPNVWIWTIAQSPCSCSSTVLRTRSGLWQSFVTVLIWPSFVQGGGRQETHDHVGEALHCEAQSLRNFVALRVPSVKYFSLFNPVSQPTISVHQKGDTSRLSCPSPDFGSHLHLSLIATKHCITTLVSSINTKIGYSNFANAN